MFFCVLNQKTLHSRSCNCLKVFVFSRLQKEVTKLKKTNVSLEKENHALTKKNQVLQERMRRRRSRGLNFVLHLQY